MLAAYRIRILNEDYSPIYRPTYDYAWADFVSWVKTHEIALERRVDGVWRIVHANGMIPMNALRFDAA